MSFPLGANLTPDGVNFAVYSKNATEVFLLLFDKPDGEPTDIIQLSNRNKFIWHILVKGLKAGQLYGYKVRGEYRPECFGNRKVLLGKDLDNDQVPDLGRPKWDDANV